MFSTLAIAGVAVFRFLKETSRLLLEHQLHCGVFAKGKAHENASEPTAGVRIGGLLERGEDLRDAIYLLLS